MASRKGRPRKTGARDKRDRLLQQKDYGNDVVQARAAAFRLLCSDSAIGHEMTCAGRLMLVGAFDGMEQPPEIYLAALLEYADGYWGNYGGGARVGQYERQDKGRDSRWEDPRGEWFDAMDVRLRKAGHQARSAVHEVTVDRHWFPDEDIGWVARIINSRFVAKKLLVCDEIACDSDWAMLQLLKAGATAIVGQAMKLAA